ncbi:MAG TPA: nicotinate (nicotinamide) nucleotide adenylyltransferase [Bacillota bacterium]|nr:nicotinate (nicotinamide) nucleotide adenylyltransferase [Bacillota bacterium]HPF42397.1 nicotinate (nicotinamide) nucleotide adenylyltransferase [Bacillota bacterium]HPJ85390.1 nicotinate (nicotinamide) nucleotide adenylyltransferase [Bacillota bacterium]HPQ61314.1 nicotinate (nicotinamide) nucleotide adenylyltransferase [Bacillota bacterium]HRX91439.1 nicotinate (nicotinamide) nucleotide adenylyltransferase [Candidatus Izemoplasmatales bacterium]
MIVIFGGAFNPPTKAHIAIYRRVRETIDCEKFIFLPVSSLYTKRSLASNQHRFEMLSLLVGRDKVAEVSPMELEDADYLGTYQSMLRFQERYPDREIVFLIGADNLLKLHKWINAKSLLAEFRFIVMNRDKRDIDKLISDDPFLRDYLDRFIIIRDFHMEMSSTGFRDSFDREMLTDEVYDYIETQGLYRG